MGVFDPDVFDPDVFDTGGQVATVGMVTETNIAQQITRPALTGTVNQAIETDISQPFGRVKSGDFSMVGEFDTAEPLFRLKDKAIGQASETDVAQATQEVKSHEVFVQEEDLVYVVGPDYFEEVMADSPVLFYRLDEASGLPQDSSGNARHADASTGTITYDQPSLITGGDSAIAYTPTSRHTKSDDAVLDIDANQDRTFEAWFASSTTGAIQSIIGKKQAFASGVGWVIHFDASNNIKVRLGSTNDILSASGAAYLDGDPHHVVYVRDATNDFHRLYVDGVQVASSQTGLPSDNFANSQSFRVGSIDTAASAGITGSIDEVAAYNTALSDTRIQAHYDAGIAAVSGAEIDIFPLKQKIVPQVVETDIANAMVAQGITEPVGQATETDISQAMAELKLRLIAQSLETDIAQAISKTKIKAVAQEVESDIAQPINEMHIRAVAQSLETDISNPLSKQKVRSVGQSVETDISQHIVGPVTKIIGQVIETDVSQAFTRRKLKLVAQEVETNIAQAITERKLKAIGQSLETELAFAMVERKLRTLGLATETDIAQVIAKRKLKLTGQAIENDLPQGVTPVQGYVVGQVLEMDFAQLIGRLKRKAIAQPLESDSAFGITEKKFKVLQQAIETELAFALVEKKLKILGQTIETDLSSPLSGAAGREVGLVTEFDIAQLIDVKTAVPVLQVVEQDIAMPLIWFRIEDIVEVALSLATPYVILKTVTPKVELDDDSLLVEVKDARDGSW
jgi:hypothetical protein